MPIPFSCGTCGSSYNAPDNLAGRKVKCKNCSASIQLPGNIAPQEAPQPAVAPAAPPRPVVAKSVPPGPTASVQPAESRRRSNSERRARDHEDEDDEEVSQSRRKSGASGSSKTLLIVLGLVLGTPILLCGGCTMFGVVSSRTAQRPAPVATATPVAASNPAPINPTPINPTPINPTLSDPVPQPQPPAALPAVKTEKPGWSPPNKVVQIGDVQVRIVKSTIGKVALKTLGRKEGKSKEKLLAISLELTNTNPTKKVEYRTWAGEDFSFGSDHATLKDNFANQYKRITFGFGSDPVGALGRSESIYPNKAIGDLLVFEIPLDAARHLDLELPAKNYGGEGMVRFRIPLDAVSRED